MMQIFLWILAAFILAGSFTFVQVLILAVAIKNSHYALYFSVLGVAGFLCWYRAWTMMKNIIAWNTLFTIGGYFVFIMLIVGCIALFANIVLLIMMKKS